jgi:hypothetical protein
MFAAIWAEFRRHPISMLAGGFSLLAIGFAYLAIGVMLALAAYFLLDGFGGTPMVVIGAAIGLACFAYLSGLGDDVAGWLESRRHGRFSRPHR